MLPTHFKKYLATILKENLIQITSVNGGCINDNYKITTNNKEYFLKLNDADYFESFIKEVDGLQFLSENSTFNIPEVIFMDCYENKAILILEFINQSTITKIGSENFGIKLAEMHAAPQPYFGWKENNYIGTIPQSNKPTKHFFDFFKKQRISPLLNLALERKLLLPTEKEWVLTKIDTLQDIFPKEPPALIHGDLWSGNYFIDRNNHPVLFDPSIHFSHREMDIAMTKLFGGFENSFYEAYHETYPMEEGWENRLAYYNLYPLLVHLLLFGKSYWRDIYSILSKI